MIRFKGRSSLKQFMPMKPIKRGIKVWVRADSHNGVCVTSMSIVAKRVTMSQQTLAQELSLTSANHFITRITMSTMTTFLLR